MLRLLLLCYQLKYSVDAVPYIPLVFQASAPVCSWNVEDLILYIGSQAKRNPPTRLNMILRYQLITTYTVLILQTYFSRAAI